MKKYIFGERNGIYIINLEVTLTCLEKAMNFLKQTASEGKEVLLVGTKRQAQEPIKEAAERAAMPYVEQRWLGGMLTNFETVRKSVARLEQIDKMEQDGSFSFVTKKEVGMLKKEREKLIKNLSGVRKMRRLPGALFVIDSKKEEIGIKEAIKLGIPVVAVLDTNCDPDLVDYPIPGNDDAIRAIKLFCDMTAQSLIDGRQQLKANQDAAAAEAAASEENKRNAAEGDGEEIAVEEELAARFVGSVDMTEEEKEKLKSKKSPRKETRAGK